MSRRLPAPSWVPGQRHTRLHRLPDLGSAQPRVRASASLHKSDLYLLLGSGRYGAVLCCAVLALSQHACFNVRIISNSPAPQGWMSHSLATSSLLKAVGVNGGAAGAAGATAAVKWITKDGIGAMGRLLVRSMPPCTICDLPLAWLHRCGLHHALGDSQRRSSDPTALTADGSPAHDGCPLPLLQRKSADSCEAQSCRCHCADVAVIVAGGRTAVGRLRRGSQAVAHAGRDAGYRRPVAGDCDVVLAQ